MGIQDLTTNIHLSIGRLHLQSESIRKVQEVHCNSKWLPCLDQSQQIYSLWENAVVATKDIDSDECFLTFITAHRGAILSRVAFVSWAAWWSCWAPLPLFPRRSMVPTKTTRTLLSWRSEGSCFAKWTLVGQVLSESWHLKVSLNFESIVDNCCWLWMQYLFLLSPSRCYNNVGKDMAQYFVSHTQY